jgi:hypothetical protein
MSSTTFAAVSALAETESVPGRFTADVDPQWTIGGKPNGGYLLAMLGRAATSVGPHEHVIAASATYLSSPDPGPITVEAEVLRAGRSASQVRARMLQDSRPWGGGGGGAGPQIRRQSGLPSRSATWSMWLSGPQPLPPFQYSSTTRAWPYWLARACQISTALLVMEGPSPISVTTASHHAVPGSPCGQLHTRRCARPR